MGSIWTVTPGNDDKVDLVWEHAPNGPLPFWIRLKKELTVGEDRHVKTAGWKGVRGVGGKEGEQEISIDWKETGLVRAFTWLTAWSLMDEKDRVLPISLPVLSSLHKDVFDLIENAITERVKEAEAKKKASRGDSAQPSTSD